MQNSFYRHADLVQRADNVQKSNKGKNAINWQVFVQLLQSFYNLSIVFKVEEKKVVLNKKPG